ncbi:probable F420-dependent oxidoreductase, Rv2161c family [Pseudonocardia thermophila]|uniref:Probable F420-dependent oxidoreductase, Rv2161c family n=1 Tax=Pseudonocardia thermophila TaxID=1848 RepID=A0A1M6XNY0_PSETH|nr:TIGR03619 family F420-dependent LLM class oxidoreductase [Pseudonocardia thermophila]SHL07720.1 probable F420-dependent oxidoreductase, Rv2161c family [Pseudonocardia thermophila]
MAHLAAPVPSPSRPFFSFAVYPPDRLTEVDDLVRVVRAAESAGFDVVQFPEHVLPPRGSVALLGNRTWWDLPTLFAFLAARTSTIRFLLGVAVLPNHEPIGFAKALATLDQLSGGRLLLGVGSGWYAAEADRLGYPFAERGAITDEYLAALVELWTSDDPSFAGRYVSFSDVCFAPRPLQRPHPPILVGGTGPRVVQRIALHGDGWLPMAIDRAEALRVFDRIRREVRAAGRDPQRLWFRQEVSWSAGGLGARTIARVHHGGTGPAGPAAPAGGAAVLAEVQELLASRVNLVSVAFAWETADELVGQLAAVGREVIEPVRLRAGALPSGCRE